MMQLKLGIRKLIPVLLLCVQVAFNFKITVKRDSLTGGSTTDGRKLSLEGTSMEVERLRKAFLEIDDNVDLAQKPMDHQEKAMESLKKALRSVEDEEQDDRKIRDIESALRSIERETAYHESRKRTNIEKVLNLVEEHTNQALTHKTTPNEGRRDGLTVSLPDEAKKIKEGRTINLKTSQGRKRVFIPKGWMFCTVSPFKCYSTNSRKKRRIKKRHISVRVSGKQTV
ncbi:uncharacterized protein [Porites lutea]|uniref:uncharacterized protein n=1 Tax=Porites lutea TaxID=51062 RepID=UPI003CC62687